jgi:uncharacterized protein (DUF362 family)
MSPVVFLRIREPSPASIAATVRDAISKAAVPESAIGERSLVKINAMSDELFPGRNTSPWVLDATLAALCDLYPRARFTVTDGDVAGAPQFARACNAWGYHAIAKRYGAKLENLSGEPVLERSTDCPWIPRISIPRAVVEADSLVNLPVLKTHVLTGITCALKNHWGLMPRLRYQLHPHVHEVIAELNRQIPNTKLTVVDGTVCIEGAGPKTGTPRVTNVIFAGSDRVAVDSAALRFIGMDPETARHVRLAEELGVGSTAFEIIGDELTPEPFDLPVKSRDLVSLAEQTLRSIPVVGEWFYAPPVAKVLGRVGTTYNKVVWMNLTGRGHARRIREHPVYGAEFR